MSRLEALFDEFGRTAFRYEGLPAYLVAEEAERIQAWREHRARPERSVRTSDWLRRIPVTTAQGKQWARVRAVDRPPPEYLRYEVNGYVENQAVGDRTSLIDREHAADVRDFSARALAGISQRSLAEQIGVSQSLVARVERAERLLARPAVTTWLRATKPRTQDGPVALERWQAVRDRVLALTEAHNFVVRHPADGSPAYVATELLHGAQTITDPGSVATYQAFWQRLWAGAVTGDLAADMIRSHAR